jgi:hypothetical protein
MRLLPEVLWPEELPPTSAVSAGSEWPDRRDPLLRLLRGSAGPEMGWTRLDDVRSVAVVVVSRAAGSLWPVYGHGEKVRRHSSLISFRLKKVVRIKRRSGLSQWPVKLIDTAPISPTKGARGAWHWVMNASQRVKPSLKEVSVSFM